MKDRIAHILKIKNITATRFADELDVQRSGISHILSGRNNPSLDFIVKIKETYPEFSLDWLLLGKGPVTLSPTVEKKSENKELSLFAEEEDEKPMLDRLQGQPENPQKEPADEQDHEQKISSSPADEEPSKPPKGKNVEKLIIMYSDRTFQAFDPAI